MEQHSEECEQSSGTTVVELFDTLWNELRGTMGSAPTAALLRRAIAISHESSPTLSIITIEKIGRDYSYNIPPEVKENPRACDEIRRFADTVLALLQELTGNVLVRHLLENPTIEKICSRGEK